jgi:hypothetical protein
MTRGIRLKQLSSADLQPLGLTESPAPTLTVQAPPAVERVLPGDPTAPAPQIGPPSNPVSGIGEVEATDPDLDWPPLDLRAIARDLRRELEITLTLLDGPSRNELGAD